MSNPNIYFYGRRLPDGLNAPARHLVEASSELLNLLASQNVNINDHRSSASINMYIDHLAQAANESKFKEEREFLANAVEVWRYFLYKYGIDIKNHAVYPRSDTVDQRLSADGLAKWTRQNVRGEKSSALRVIRGKALRSSIDKTVPIIVDRHFKHKHTGKFTRKSKKYLVHDEFNTVSQGDFVVATETRPLSKRKHFLLFAILLNS